MKRINKFEFSTKDKKSLYSASKLLSDALLSASKLSKNLTKAFKMMNDALPTAEQAEQNLRINTKKPFYRVNDKY